MNDKFVSATGRRKESIARVWLYQRKGETTVNGKKVNEYFSSDVAQKFINKPLEVTGVQGQYWASIKVSGGGVSSQAGAVVHGIARALSKADEKLKPTLKKHGLLTRDARAKERRKYGHAGKARSMKQSPKR